MDEREVKTPAPAPTDPTQKTPAPKAAPARRASPARKATPAARPRPAQGKAVPAQKRRPPKKKPAAAPEDDLPLWLARLVDWAADLPLRLKTLPGRFVKLFDSWFYRIYFPVVGVLILIICIGFGWLNGFAADYEAAQPIHVADEVGQIFAEGDYDRLYDLDTAAGDIGDRAFYASSLRELSEGGDIAWYESYDSEKDALRYNVTLNGSRFATFTLVPTGQVTGHNNTLWQLGTVTTNIALEQNIRAQDPANAPCRVRAPEGYVVTVDGRRLGPEDAIRTGISMYDSEFLPRDVSAPTITEYGFTPEGETPQIAATDPEGADAPVREDSENIWVCPLKEDAEVKARFSDSVTRLAERVAKYTTADLSRSAMLTSVISGSPAETTLKAFNSGWAPSHKSERFENMTVSDFCMLSDTCLTCHVKFDYILTSRRKNDYPYPTEYTFCIVRKGGEGKLYNLVFH